MCGDWRFVSCKEFLGSVCRQWGLDCRLGKPLQLSTNNVIRISFPLVLINHIRSVFVGVNAYFRINFYMGKIGFLARRRVSSVVEHSSANPKVPDSIPGPVSYQGHGL